MTLCVYALTGAARVGGTGLAGERLRLVGTGPVRAVVGRLARPPRPETPNILKYDRTLRALAERLPAVLPARFGTCFDSLDELDFVLRSRGASLRGALAHVRGRVQMTVRVLERAPAGHAPSAPPARPAVLSGRDFLRQRAAEAARDRDIPGFEPVRDAVRRWVRDERVEKRARLVSVYHLVPRRSAPAYGRALRRAAAAAGLQVTVSGPWPPYAFATW